MDLSKRAELAHRAVVLTALRDEYLAVQSHLEDLSPQVHPRGTEYEIGYFRGGDAGLWQVVIAEIGMGNNYAGIETERAISYWEPTLVAFVGIAGGLKDLELGDVVIAEQVYGYEAGKDAEDLKPRIKSQSSSYALVQRSRAIARQDKWRKRILSPDPACVPTAVVGTIAAGEKVVADTRSATYRFLAAHCSDALAVEMEGWGFLLGTYANNNMTAIVIRAISDAIDDKSPAADKRWQPIAARHAAGFAFELLATWRPPLHTLATRDATSTQILGPLVAPDSEPRPDFLIIYASADRAWADWFAWQLEESGYSVLSEARDSRSGPASIAKLYEGSRRPIQAVAVTSHAYLASESPTLELDEIFSTGAQGPQLTPILVASIDTSELAGRGSIDLVGLDEEAARIALLEGVRRLRAKAPLAPQFPPGSISGSPARPRFPLALPPIWNVPRPRNPDFRGREDLLDDLSSNLMLGETTVLTQAIVGMGGIGKTELATEFAYRHKSDYDLVWWVRAEEPTTLATDYAALAVPLGLDLVGWPDQATVVGAVRDQLQARSRWLLVFDNVLAREDVVDFIPAAASGHVLITSRTQTWPDADTRLAVDLLPLDDAAQFLLARTGETDKTSAEALATALGRLPLALEQAAAYLAQATDLVMADYLKRLRPETTKSAANRQPADPPQTVVSTWSLSIQSVKNPAATQLLDFAAFLAPDDIPIGLLFDVADLLPEPLAWLAESQLGFDDIVETLGRYSLITVLGDAFAVHRLVQAIIRRGLEPETQNRWASIVVRALYRVFPRDASDSRSWAVCARLLPHAIAASTLAQDAHTNLEETSWLLDLSGRYLRSRGEFAAALELSERAVALGRLAFGPDDQDLATILNTHAMVLRDAGLWPESKAYFEEALALDQRSVQHDPADVGAILQNLALLLRDLGDFVGARDRAVEALSIFDEHYGADHRDVGIVLNTLARSSLDLQDVPRAEEYARRALAIHEADLGLDHPLVGDDLHTLALVKRHLGDLPAARELAERALDIYQAAYGSSHPRVGQHQNILALILRDLGDPLHARLFAEQALAIHEASYAPDHPRVGDDLLTLGLVLEDLGDNAEATSCIKRAVTIYEAAYGPDHPQVADTLKSLAHVLANTPGASDE